VGLTLYNLDKFIEGNIDEMVEALQTSDMEQRLKEADAGE
jgi:protein subunit release factor A